MSLIPIYRTLLKRIHAAKNYPYHLQDIRFILSYPPVEITPSTKEILNTSIESKEKIDSSFIVKTCCKDLRQAILETKNNLNNSLNFSNLSPVAKYFIHMRELAWLKTRLENIVNEETDKILKEAKIVASDLNNNDFIEDDVFSNDDLHNNNNNNNNNSFNSLETNNDIQTHVGIASAGVIGPRREMFILQHISSFPFVKEFLSSFNMNYESVALASTCNEKLVDFVQHNIPNRIMCQNEDIMLTVTVRPFDSGMNTTEFIVSGKTLGNGINNNNNNNNNPFAHAHRYFMLHFSIIPHNSSICVDIVNSYFLRLDATSSELIEDVGYIHAAHVWKLAQVFNKENNNNNNNGFSDYKFDNAPPQFELSFLNPCDGPMVMKGQLYYIIRKENDNTPVSELPIRSISFGHLLLFNSN